jgi:hypothetical protein
MKNSLILGIAVLFLSSCITKNEQQAKSSGTEIFFAESTYDYGQIEVDSDGIYKIEFKNLGEDAIIINRVRSSCGCTIPSWPREPIESKGKGVIEVKYNTALAGSFMKSVYVYSSAVNSPVKLTIKGKVMSKEKTE